MYLGNAEFTLEKGEYYIIAEVDWIQATKDKTFALTVYSEHNVIFEDITGTINIEKIMMKSAESNFKFMWREYELNRREENGIEVVE